MNNLTNPIPRTQSLNTLKRVRHHPVQTLAEKNVVSLKQSQQKYFLTRPLRIILPDFFNIPKFIDLDVEFGEKNCIEEEKNKAIATFKLEKGLKRKLKDLSVLAQGMKRAKNIKEQSRYYFIQGVILHNTGAYEKSIQMFEKFLKIVLFIKDQKSIQLALNSIGIAYMYMNRPQGTFYLTSLEAIQYHQKQVSLNQDSESFIGHINIGLCVELKGNRQKAHQIYFAILQNEQILNPRKKQLISKLYDRTKQYQPESHFITQNLGLIDKQKRVSTEKQNAVSNSKNKKLRHSPNRKHLNSSSFLNKKYQNAKISFAIFNAEQNLNGYLKDMKNSFNHQQ